MGLHVLVHQGLELLRDPLAAQAARAEMEPCWALMVEFCEALPVRFDAAQVTDSPLAWLALVFLLRRRRR